MPTTQYSWAWRKSEMICKVKSAVEKYHMPIEGKTVIAALSGGADSMALLNVMLSLKDEYNFKLIACHVNHGIRGKQADSDENFVRDYCSEKNIELHVLKADVPKLAAEQGIGLEECGRKVRYNFFKSIDSEALIATAHTLSDRCETLLLNETRGTSVRGLRSIPAVRGNIIRPLIDCTRAEIEAYCTENNIPYVTDETNFDENYSRNRIRLNVLPELKKINPSVELAFIRLIESASEDEKYFDELVNDIIGEAKTDNGYDVRLIISQRPAIRRRIIARIITEEANAEPELVHIKLVENILSSGKVEIIGNNVITVRNNYLTVNPQPVEYREWQCDFSGFSADTPSGKFSGTIFNKNESPLTQIVHKNVLDFDSTVGTLIMRNRRAGDEMKMASSNCTKSLKKLFNEKHIDNRNNICIIADDCGVVWVQGLGCSDRCKITDKTMKVLVISEDEKND
jgi:tRNA(Ile)-lysidine synthase